jgi:2-dehydropantoate 2-reductase
MRTSLQEDLAAGAPSELDALGGALLRVGERHALELSGIARIVAALDATAG